MYSHSIEGLAMTLALAATVGLVVRTRKTGMGWEA